MKFSTATTPYFFLGLSSVSRSTFVEKEVILILILILILTLILVLVQLIHFAKVLIYPWTSLVAEFGGTLGLFLGFSAMTLWDCLEWIAMWKFQLVQNLFRDVKN